MPTSDETKTMPAGSRDLSGEHWKEEYSDRERDAMRESGEDCGMSDESIGAAASAFAGLLEGVDSDPDDEDLGFFQDEDIGVQDHEDWDDFPEDADLDAFEDLDEF